MPSSVSAAIGRLVDLCTNGFTGTAIDGTALYGPNGQPAVPVPGLSTVNSEVLIGDTRPDVSSDVYVIIGRESDQSDSQIQVQLQYQVLGRQRIQESYEIPVYISVMMDGPDQAPARAAVQALFDAFVVLVWSDPSLGGILLQGRLVAPASYTLTQPDNQAGSGSAGGGVAAEIGFVLAVENSYVP